MTSLFYAGTLFSGWQQLVKKQLLRNSKSLSASDNLSAFSRKLCGEYYPVTNELSWRSFSPDEMHMETARQLIKPAPENSIFSWADSNNSLLLDFWRAVSADTRFVLFYSSPEYELSKYINTHPFDAANIKMVVEAWLIRTKAMLAFFMHNRSVSLFLNTQSTHAQGNILNQSINEKFDLDLDLVLEHEITRLAHDDHQGKNSALLEYLASTLLLDNEHVAEIYDEVRSVATVVCDQDKMIAQIQARNSALVAEFLDEYIQFKQVALTNKKLGDEQFLKQLQINQLTEDTEFFCSKTHQQEQVISTFSDYLQDSALLKVARLVRSK